MTKERKEFKKLNIHRKKLLSNIFFEIITGILMGICCSKAIETVEGQGEYMAICILIFVIMCVFLWTPLFVASAQIYDITQTSIKAIPKMNSMKKWKMIFHILCVNDIEPFLKIIPLSSIQRGKFSVDRHSGVMAYSRYSYMLTLYMEHESITLYINPIENGPLMPSGKGGYLFHGCKSREDICNMVQFFEMNHVHVEDPYHIIDALKNPNIVIYDYLESLNIKIRY